MENSWFPVESELIENEEFRTLTATEKLYMFQVMSDFNLEGGEYYKADIEYAATLKLSLEKIRKARAKLSKCGFITMIPGRQDVGRKRNIATTYKDVMGIDTAKGQWSQIDRPTFELLIDLVRANTLSHEDVVCWVYICHIVWVKGGSFALLSKGDFTHITNMPNAIKFVKNLVGKFKYSNGQTLFDFEMSYRSVKFESVRTVMFTQERIEKRRKNIEELAKKLRTEEQKKEQKKRMVTGEVLLKDLIPSFEHAYEMKYKSKLRVSYGNEYWEEKLKSIGEPEEIFRAMGLYLSTDFGSTKHSLSHFFKNADGFIEQVRKQQAK